MMNWNRSNELKTRNQSIRNRVDQSLFLPLEQFLGRSGKRIRESLVQLAFQLAGGRGTAPNCLSESVEWLHAGSLVIDDIQDESRLRRGQPTLHRQIGLPLAINAGNWMYFQALERLMDSSLSDVVQHWALARMIAAARQCHEGQSLDLTSRVDSLDHCQVVETARAISRLKTGSLVALATSLGAIAAGGKAPIVRAIARFGMEIGVALQMRNDLDELRTIAESGPAEPVRMDDLRNARVTWPWAWAAQLVHAGEFYGLARRISDRPLQSDTAKEVSRCLMNIVNASGERVIERRVRRQLRLLREHIVDDTLVAQLSALLEPISPSTVEKNNAIRN